MTLDAEPPGGGIPRAAKETQAGGQHSRREHNPRAGSRWTRADYARLMGRDRVGAWARQVIEGARQAGEVPRYGSAEWQALDDDDPRQIAAIIVAAECWRLESSPMWIAARTEAELDGDHAVAVADFEGMWRRTLDDIARVDRARAHGSDIGYSIGDRRRIAARPRPGDRVGPARGAMRGASAP